MHSVQRAFTQAGVNGGCLMVTVLGLAQPPRPIRQVS